ncbi:MAG: hypothetical protein LJE74_10390 [Proteobacteria bacterium]|jgi:uncharacterized membrane protein|nr:hypothetical protein [Pseudomonadota bacterium]MCG6936494.1 hypothetical protein [Pseudomonadota bacterium]
MQQQYTRDADFGIQVDPALITLTKIIYLLQALGYLTLLSYVAAVIINYVKIDEVRGTWLESHFQWQIRTFWYSLVWYIIGAVTFVIIVGYFILIANTIWVIYRIIKGWLRLLDNKSMDLQ